MSYKLYIEDNVTPPAVIWSDTDPGAGYTDYSSNIEKWDQCGPTSVDVYTVRSKIKTLVQAIAGTDYSTWNSLQAAEKKVASYWKVAPYAKRVPDEVSDTVDQLEWMYIMESLEGSNKSNLKGRGLIYFQMRLIVSDYVRIETLSRSDSEDLFAAISGHANNFVYVDSKDLLQWLTNEVSSPYEFAGFAEKSYYTAGIKDAILGKYNGEF